VPRSQPPLIPGLVYREELGGGGFADVFLYQSLTPRRLVAVKVLRTTDIDAKLAGRFAAEADVMAALEHPHIVRVYDAGMTQDGRPFIEMAYYPSETLAETLRRGPFSVPDVLRIGVQLASAIETAHRAGLLHRDVKPANVLTDRYGQPALSDFGIASRLNEADDDVGLSLPWAPPEAIFATSPVDQRSDVYSLAATLWQLLVGRPPFEVPGGDNRPVAMMVRIRDLPPPQTGRGDVPASLERLLAASLSKDPRSRPMTAADFARALGLIEEELRLRPTPFIVERDRSVPAGPTPARTPVPPPAPLVPATLGNEPTHRRPTPQSVVAQIPAPVPPFMGGSLPVPVAPSEGVAATVRRAGVPPVVGAQGPVTPVDSRPPSAPEEVPSRVTLQRILIGASVTVMVLGLGTWWLVSHPFGAPGPLPTPTPTVATTGNVGLDLPPGRVTITCDRKTGPTVVTCAWTYANALTTDKYRVRLPGGNEEAANEATWSGTAAAEQSYCISVKVVRQDGRFPQDWSQEGCA